MRPFTKDTVRYMTCELMNACWLPAFKGPLDGEEEFEYRPDRCPDGHMILWYYSEDGTHESCATYQTAWRFCQTGGYEGPCLVWVP